MYTRIGPVLLSINPYKWIASLYDDEAMVSYQGKADLVESGDLAPHLFGVADHAYSQLVSNCQVDGRAIMLLRKHYSRSIGIERVKRNFLVWCPLSMSLAS